MVNVNYQLCLKKKENKRRSNSDA